MKNLGGRPCRDWEDMLAVSHPEDLSPAQWSARNKHIASCPACASVLSEYQEMEECIRRTLTPPRPLKLPPDFAIERSSLQREDKREKWMHGHSAPPVQAFVPTSLPAPVGDMDCRSSYYTVHIEALCVSQYMEVLPEQLLGAEVLVEVHLGELLLSLFETVFVEDVSLDVFSAPPRGRQRCSLTVQAHCQGSGETKPQYSLEAMEMTVEETISSILFELLGVVNVDAVNIRCFTRDQVESENGHSKSA